ncbi:MAG: NUDIX domain-containing protein [Bacteroidales bacterium]|nr:NUDIX domain-containing protein [Bacteroidales bacterium]
MRKIFFKGNRISIVKDSEDSNSLLVDIESKEQLHSFLKAWLKDSKKKDVALFGYDRKRLKSDFKKFFFYIEAAGGVVFNQNNQVLFIYRSGIWDLPKGKIDKNEAVKHCALREVEEETGVGGLQIKERLKPSYHVYWHNDNWYLKKTYWFFMETSSNNDLVPQVEEEITEARWMNLNECQEALNKSYRSLHESIGNEICQYFEKHKK